MTTRQGSSRSRPAWVHWQKHRGMQRFFSTHQAYRYGFPLRWLVTAGIWKDIAVLEEGGRLPETRQLSAEENRAVLAELKAIMSVYGDSGSCSTD